MEFIILVLLISVVWFFTGWFVRDYVARFIQRCEIDIEKTFTYKDEED